MAKRRSKKPYVMTVNEEGKTVFVEYDTYRELLGKLKQVFTDFMNNRHRCEKLYGTGSIAHDDYVRVFRYLRGEWGERFEYWKVEEGKLIQIKAGWM